MFMIEYNYQLLLYAGIWNELIVTEYFAVVFYISSVNIFPLGDINYR